MRGSSSRRTRSPSLAGPARSVSPSDKPRPRQRRHARRAVPSAPPGPTREVPRRLRRSGAATGIVHRRPGARAGPVGPGVPHWGSRSATGCSPSAGRTSRSPAFAGRAPSRHAGVRKNVQRRSSSTSRRRAGALLAEGRDERRADSVRRAELQPDEAPSTIFGQGVRRTRSSAGFRAHLGRTTPRGHRPGTTNRLAGMEGQRSAPHGLSNGWYLGVGEPPSRPLIWWRDRGRRGAPSACLPRQQGGPGAGRLRRRGRLLGGGKVVLVGVRRPAPSACHARPSCWCAR